MSEESTSRIIIEVSLDEEKLPQAIRWRASDQPGGALTEAKAMLVSFFDKASKDTLKIDLWTKEMQVAEMDRFIYHSIKAMADTYYKSTGNRQLASAMQQFATYFGEEAEIIPRQES